MEKNRGPWVSWPARPPEGGGRWIPQVEIKAKNLKEVIEKALLERYREIEIWQTEEPIPFYKLKIPELTHREHELLTKVKDRAIEEIKVGMPLEMSFRKLYSTEGVHNYFWKAIPVRA